MSEAPETFNFMPDVDEYVIKHLIDHRVTDITERTYSEPDIEWLRS